MFCVDDISSSGFKKKLTTPISHMDSLSWTLFSAMKAEKQISAAKQLVPIVHQTSGIQRYKSFQSVKLFIILLSILLMWLNFDLAVKDIGICFTSDV